MRESTRAHFPDDQAVFGYDGGMRVFAMALTIALLVALAPAQCITFGAFASAGTVPTGLQPPGTLNQVSGVAASRHNPGVIWVHDDSHHSPHVVALRTDGKLVQQYIVAGVKNMDWEDIAIGPGPDPGRSYIYIGDIGNNNAPRTVLQLIRFPEPTVPGKPGATITISGAEVFRFSYPNATPADSECLMIDPVDGTAYLLTKTLPEPAELYHYPLPFDSSKVKTLQKDGVYPGLGQWVTAGDVSSDGRWIHLRSYLAILSYPRPSGKSFAEALKGTPCTLLLWQGQAEALAIDPDGLGLTAISEGAGTEIWHARGTMPPGLPKTIPSWWCSGTGLGGKHGIPGVGALGAPVLGGSPFTIGLFGGAPSAAGFVVLSPTFFPDGKVPFRGGWVHVLPDVFFPIALSTVGAQVVSFGVLPDHALLHGKKVYLQAVYADTTAPQGVSMTAGFTIHLDR